MLDEPALLQVSAVGPDRWICQTAGFNQFPVEAAANAAGG